MEHFAAVDRKTDETEVSIELNLNGKGSNKISTGIPFFDHMLKLFAAHGFFDLSISAKGDIEVDFHHTVEDVGLVLGEAFDKAIADGKGIKRFGHSVVPMDDALTSVTVDLSKRPFLIYNIPVPTNNCKCFGNVSFDTLLAKEFFRAFTARGGMNLHINFFYGENGHHILESIFKAFGRSLDEATSLDSRIEGVLSTKGFL